MVVEQEMAEIYPPDPEDLFEFLPGTDCTKCGFQDCLEFAAAVLDRSASASKCTEVESEVAKTMDAIAGLNKDPIPYNIMMEQTPCEMIEVNDPHKNSPLVVTANFQETVRIMKEIMEGTSMSGFLLPTFTHGYSVDNAVHEKMFKAMEVLKAIQENGVEQRLARPVMIIPGLARTERNSIRQMTRWEVLEGPESGFLLPLFALENRDAFA